MAKIGLAFFTLLLGHNIALALPTPQDTSIQAANTAQVGCGTTQANDVTVEDSNVLVSEGCNIVLGRALASSDDDGPSLDGGIGGILGGILGGDGLLGSLLGGGSDGTGGGLGGLLGGGSDGTSGGLDGISG